MVHKSPALRIQDALISAMGYKNSKKSMEYEIQIQKAISAYKLKKYSSIRATTRTFKVPHNTLIRRLNDGVSRTQAHQLQQILTNTEESTPIR